MFEGLFQPMHLLGKDRGSVFQGEDWGQSFSMGLFGEP